MLPTVLGRGSLARYIARRFIAGEAATMTRMTRLIVVLMLMLAATFVLQGPAGAAAVRPGVFTGNTLPGNDDGSTGSVPIGFTLNFFGVVNSNLFVNNNGNVTFNGPLSTFTPFGLTTNIGTPIIAAFFADVDTRGAINDVTYGAGTVDGHAAFGVNYLNVGYYNQHADKLNTFQLILIDRSDTGVNNFDIEFNYDQIQWETGDASGGSGGLGGSSARVGFSNGTGTAGTFFELPGSGVNGAFLDGGPNSLVGHSLNSNVLGRYVFAVREGQPVVTPTVPEPATIALVGAGLVGGALARFRRRRRP
jgi:hypothetical protein